MRIIFVRHGHSVANEKNVFSNCVDQEVQHELTELGIKQAKDLATILAKKSITAIYASPIHRAQQTAEIVSKRLGIPVKTDNRLIEFHCGENEGKSDDASWKIYHEVVEAWLVRGEYDARIPGGESFNDIKKRFIPFIKQIIQTHGAYDVVVIISHGGIYKCMLPVVLDNITHDDIKGKWMGNTDCVIAELGLDEKLICTSWCGIDMPSAKFLLQRPHDTNFFTTPNYDENFNNIRKVKFEMAFTRLVRDSHSALVFGALNKVSKGFWAIFEKPLMASVDEASTAPFEKVIFDKFWEYLGPNSTELGRTEQQAITRGEFVIWLKSIFEDESNSYLETKLRLHLTCELIYFSALTRFPQERDELKKYFPEFQTTFYDSFFPRSMYGLRGRISRDPFRMATVTDITAYNRYENLVSNTTIFGFIPRNSDSYDLQKWNDVVVAHQRGMDLYRVVTPDEKTAQHDARYRYDMPLVTSLSVSIKKSIRNCKLFANMSAEEYRFYLIGAIAYLAIGGHHTFHECACVAKRVGFPYEEGNYASILPRTFIEENKVALQELQKQFPGLLRVDFENLPSDPKIESSVFSFQIK